MKRFNFVVLAAIFVAVLSFAASASAQDVKQGVVTVVRIQGSARYSSGDNVWHPLTIGKALGAGDVIQTAADSAVDVVLADKVAHVGSQQISGSLIGGTINVAGLPITPITGQSAPSQNVIRLQADTVLAVDKFTFSQTGVDTVSDTELDLRAGKIFGNLKKISAASRYIIKTPNGVAGIRGTIFALGANGSVTVLQGSVVISGVTNTGNVYTEVLTAGQSFNPQTQGVTNLSKLQEAIALAHAQEIVIAINEAVTVVETPTASGGDTTQIHVSPTSGLSGTIIFP